MSKNKSEMLSVFGTVWEIVRLLWNAVLERGGSDDDIRRVLSDTSLVGKLADVILKTEKNIFYPTATYTVTIDETLSVEEVVKMGKFYYSDDNIISTKFPKPASGQRSDKKVFIFHFNKQMTSKEVITEMDKAGYKPANIWVLIGLAIKEFNLQKKFPIVALDSVGKFAGPLDVPSLCGGNSQRNLFLYSFGSDWHGRCRFLAVRN